MRSFNDKMKKIRNIYIKLDKILISPTKIGKYGIK